MTARGPIHDTLPCAEPPTCAFVTYGCKINFYDTQAIRESVLALGYREVEARAGADLYIVNSCAVTERAEADGLAEIRRIARNRPGTKFLVTGCMSEEQRGLLRSIPGVLDIAGNEEKDQIPALLQGAPRRATEGRRSRSIFRLHASHFTGRTRAFLKVQDGCDSFCTYCIIPFLRGKAKSRDLADILAEARRFADAGHRELVLTGIHLSQYGRDLGNGDDLVALMEKLRAIAGIDRVRLSSIGEGAFSERFISLFQRDGGCCPFFHIPLQSGSDAVLTRMRRDYSRADYLTAIDRIRTAVPHAQIATDLMVGFPGETDSEFEESLDVCERAGFGKIHIFPYSTRAGTRAARMPERVPAERVRERLARARTLAARLAQLDHERHIGRRMRVLVEREESGRAAGLAREGYEVQFAVAAPERLWNHEFEVAIEAASDGRLIGNRVNGV